jgi:hypothetical protein
MPHFCAKSHCLGAFVQLLSNQNFNGSIMPMYPITSANGGAFCGFVIFRAGQTSQYQARLSVPTRLVELITSGLSVTRSQLRHKERT